MKCLENLIGISNTDCICVTDGLSEAQKAELKLSVSGLYLDTHLEGGLNLRDIKTLDACGDFFALAKRAIVSAKKKFEDDLEIGLGSRYKSSKPTFRGELGRLTYTGSLAKNKEYQFIKIVPNAVSDAVMRINGGRIIVNNNDVLNVYILAGFEGEEPQVIHTTSVEVFANMFANFELPQNLVLPLSVDGRKMVYYFAWNGNAETQARDNGTKCNCTGGNAYDGYLSLKGGETDALNNFNVKEDNYAHGFTIDVDIRCEAGALFCREFDSQNKIAVASAWANLYKAGELLIEYVLNSPEITRFTLMNREYLRGKRNHFRKEYEMRIQYLTYEIDVTKGDCFVCQQNSIFVGNLFG